MFRDSQERLLKSAGFTTVEIYGAHDFSPYSGQAGGKGDAAPGAAEGDDAERAWREFAVAKEGLPSP